jgi:hypothetical protein
MELKLTPPLIAPIPTLCFFSPLRGGKYALNYNQEDAAGSYREFKKLR